MDKTLCLWSYSRAFGHSTGGCAKQKAQKFILQYVNFWNSFDANAMTTILTEERQSATICEHVRMNKGTKDPGMTLPMFKGDQNDWKN